MDIRFMYDAVVVRIIDGDTVVVDIDLGFSLTTRQVVRLSGINAPEMIGSSHSQGLLAKQFILGAIPPGSSVIVKTIKPNDKYGRYLAEIYEPGSTISVNERMVVAGHAVRYMV